jgi:disulfide bond formation protein DsbB
LGAVVALYNAGLGAYHAGIEWKWWPGPPSCTSTGLGLSTDLGDLSGIRPVMCDEAAWRMFGLSMAGYNALASLAAAAIAGLAGWRLFAVNRVFALLRPGLRRLQWKGSAS